VLATYSPIGNLLLAIETCPGNRVAPNGYGAPVQARAKNERHRGARPSVGGGVRAPHRLTIRLSEAQLEALQEVARDMGMGGRGLATAARALLVEAVRGSRARSKRRT